VVVAVAALAVAAPLAVGDELAVDVGVVDVVGVGLVATGDLELSAIPATTMTTAAASAIALNATVRRAFMGAGTAIHLPS
jgi:hypothetical protein